MKLKLICICKDGLQSSRQVFLTVLTYGTRGEGGGEAGGREEREEREEREHAEVNLAILDRDII